MQDAGSEGWRVGGGRGAGDEEGDNHGARGQSRSYWEGKVDP